MADFCHFRDLRLVDLDSEPWPVGDGEEAVGVGEASGAAMKRSLKPLSVLLAMKMPCWGTKP